MFFQITSLHQKAHAKTPSKNQVDRLALAALLIKDGHFDRADAVLSEIDLRQKNVSLARYYSLRGAIGLHTKAYVKAALYLRKAVEQKGVDPMVWLFLAQARFQLGRYAKALEALQHAPPQAFNLGGTLLLQAQSLWKLKRFHAAYQAIEQGSKRFSKEDGFLRLKVLWLLEKNLIEQAHVLGWHYLQAPRRSAEDHLGLAEAMRRRKQPSYAALWLEQALLRFPSHPQILMLLARCYLENRKTLTAAIFLERAAQKDRKLLVEAAELYRRAGQPWKALYLNAQVADQKAKIKQRLGLLIEMKRYEEAAVMGSRLSRLDLLEDQRVLYALGFAAFQIGRYKTAHSWLAQITDPSLFQRSIALRKTMQSCLKEQEAWWCP
ncbi:tetratricopeptide repeat protein [Myxococcota bacterium]|nr:tetratricopeptide repeat protein [Myxococcota bacterium]